MHILRDTWAYLCWLWVLGLKPTKARLKNEIIQSVRRLSCIRSRSQTPVVNVLTEELVGRGKMISQVLDEVTCTVLSLYFINLSHHPWITSRLWGPAQALLEMKCNNGTMSYIIGEKKKQSCATWNRLISLHHENCLSFIYGALGNCSFCRVRLQVFFLSYL